MGISLRLLLAAVLAGGSAPFDAWSQVAKVVPVEVPLDGGAGGSAGSVLGPSGGDAAVPGLGSDGPTLGSSLGSAGGPKAEPLRTAAAFQERLGSQLRQSMGRPPAEAFAAAKAAADLPPTGYPKLDAGIETARLPEQGDKAALAKALGGVDLASPGEVAAALERIDHIFWGTRPRSSAEETPPVENASAAAASAAAPAVRPLRTQGATSPAAAVSETPPPGGGVPTKTPFRRDPRMLGAAWIFLTLTAMSMILPVRGAFLNLNFGANILPWVYMASAAGTGLAVFVYNRFSKLPRAKVIGGSLVALAASLLLWWPVALAFSQVAAVSFGFYIWTDVFSIMAVTLFWTFANDVFKGDAARKSFGLFVSAAAAGGIAGYALTWLLGHVLAVENLLLVAGLIFAATLFVFHWAERLMGKAGTEETPAKTDAKPVPVWKLIASSKFLVLLAVLVALERMVPDFSYYIYNAELRHAFPTKEAFTSASALFGLVQNGAGAVLSFWLTKKLLKRFGEGVALAAMPAANLLGMLLYAFMPTLAVAVGFNAVEGVFRYTWFKAAKEETYTVESKDVIYRVKASIEMFVYRFSRAIAGLILLGVTALPYFSTAAVAAAVFGVPLAGLFVFIAWRLGKEFKKRAAGLDNNG